MKILVVCEGVTKYSVFAQPWKHAFELAKRMIRHGNDVELLTNIAAENSIDNAINGVPIIMVKKGKFFFHSDQILKYLNDKKFDVINWHGSDAWSTIHIWRIRKKLRNNVVWTLHSGPLSVNDIKNLKLSELFALTGFWNNVVNSFWPSYILRKWMNLPQIKGVIALSQRLKMYLVRKGIKNEEEVEVIRSGVDVKKFNPLSKEQITGRGNCIMFDDKSDKVVLYFGPPSPLRGVDTLFKAMPQVIKNFSNVKLLLLIRGADRKIKWLEKVAGKIEGKVLIIEGVLSEEALINYLSLADIIVLPFRFWPQVECPLTILEAMAMSKTVVTTNVGAIPEIVVNGENGILVPPNDPKRLANAIIKLLLDPSKSREIGRRARMYVEYFHNWDDIVKDTLSVFSRFEACT